MPSCSQYSKTFKRADKRAGKLIDEQNAIAAEGQVLKQKYDMRQKAAKDAMDRKTAMQKKARVQKKALADKQMAERKKLAMQCRQDIQKIQKDINRHSRHTNKLKTANVKLSKKYYKKKAAGDTAEAKVREYISKHKECKLKPIKRKRLPKVPKV